MNLDELQSVQARERQSDSLQELRPSFYQDAAEFVAELRAERSRVAADAEEPFEDPTVTQLTDDIRTAEGTVEAIYERRVGKVVKLASLAAANMPADDAGLTTEEQDLYETLTAAIESHREEVIATLSGDAGANASRTAATPEASSGRPSAEADAIADPDESVDAADLMGSGADDTDGSAGEGSDRSVSEGQSADEADDGQSRTDSAESESAGANDGAVETDEERTTVRITQDVGAILGVDEREYDLATDDVVTLPAANAEPLIERDAAERLD